MIATGTNMKNRYCAVCLAALSAVVTIVFSGCITNQASSASLRLAPSQGRRNRNDLQSRGESLDLWIHPGRRRSGRHDRFVGYRFHGPDYHGLQRDPIRVVGIHKRRYRVSLFRRQRLLPKHHRVVRALFRLSACQALHCRNRIQQRIRPACLAVLAG